MSTEGDAATAPRTIKASEFKAKCLSSWTRWPRSGEEIVITKHGRPVSKLAPYREKPKAPFGRHRGILRSSVTSPSLSTWNGRQRVIQTGY